MEIKGGNYVSQIKRLSDRILEQILAEKNIDAFNGAQGRILYVLWSRDGISLRELADKTGLASTTLTSIINGLGKTKDTFLITCVSQSMKLFCLVALVPHFGIMAYIYGTILSQAFMALLCYLTARHLLA